MVFENECTKIIYSSFPEFIESDEWKEYIEFWEKKMGGGSLCAKMSSFSHYISDVLKGDISSSIVLKKVFDFIEKLMLEGDQVVQNAAATCFLENLINYTSNSGLPSSTFIHLLGKESKEYCKAWDEFTGVKTKGLWD